MYQTETGGFGAGVMHDIVKPCSWLDLVFIDLFEAVCLRRDINVLALPDLSNLEEFLLNFLFLF